MSGNKVLLGMISFDFCEIIFLIETSDSVLCGKLKLLVHVCLWFCRGSVALFHSKKQVFVVRDFRRYLLGTCPF